MSCRKAFELDLADFVVAPDSDRWTGFRAHYPTCRACASEVAIWKEVQTVLRSGRPEADTAHPPKELLLRNEEQAHTLSAGEKAALGRHLATCRTCPDELAALRGFDFSALEHDSPPLPRRWRPFAATLVARVGQVALHPVFAYTLVLVLLYTVVVQPRLADRISPADHIALEATRQPSEGRNPSIPDADSGGETAPPAPAVARMPARPAQEPANIAAVSDTRRAGAPPPHTGRPTRSKQPGAKSPDAPADRAVDDGRLPKEPPAADELAADLPDEGTDTPEVLGLTESEEPQDVERRVDPDDPARERVTGRTSWQTIVLGPDRTPEVQHTTLVTGLLLRLPTSDHDLEVRVVRPDGRDADHETIRAPSGAPTELRLPAGDLANGTYRVVLTRRGDGGAPQPTSELLFVVR